LKIASETVVTVFLATYPGWSHYIHGAHSSIKTSPHWHLEVLLVYHIVVVWRQLQNVKGDLAGLIAQVFRNQAKKELHHLVQSRAECNGR